MLPFIIKVFVNGVALSVAAYLLTGIHLGQEGARTSDQLVTVVLVAVIFGLVNALIKPVLHFFAMPAIILTLGLFTLVVNAAMLELTSWLADQVNVAFHVDEFLWDAVFGSVIISIVAMFLHLILPDGER